MVDDSQRTGYLAAVKLRALPRALVVGTVLATLLLAAGGFLLGRSIGAAQVPGAAPVRVVQPAEQPDPIVIPEKLEVPGA